MGTGNSYHNLPPNEPNIFDFSFVYIGELSTMYTKPRLTNSISQRGDHDRLDSMHAVLCLSEDDRSL